MTEGNKVVFSFLEAPVHPTMLLSKTAQCKTHINSTNLRKCNSAVYLSDPEHNSPSPHFPGSSQLSSGCAGIIKAASIRPAALYCVLCKLLWVRRLHPTHQAMLPQMLSKLLLYCLDLENNLLKRLWNQVQTSAAFIRGIVSKKQLFQKLSHHQKQLSFQEWHNPPKKCDQCFSQVFGVSPCSETHFPAL